MTRFRHHSALAVAAVIAAIGALPMTALGGVLAFTPLIPLVVAFWAWHCGTDANAYGLRVRALAGRKIIPWTDVEALVPDSSGKVRAVLTNGNAVQLTAVRAQHLPRLIAVADLVEQGVSREVAA